ncbi:MAG: DUF1284 domain-containing protein [Chloroflexi bacterium]|nr:DUF1284 domain-containing protein [Chloroflexota bacterium]
MQLRPHHLLCIRFVSDGSLDSSRGDVYTEARKKLLEFVEGNSGDVKATVEVKEGHDTICAVCPHFNGRECAHPAGGEEGVRKWDAKVLQGLGLHFGQVIEVSRLSSLIKEKTPMDFCVMKCPRYRHGQCRLNTAFPGAAAGEAPR